MSYSLILGTCIFIASDSSRENICNASNISSKYMEQLSDYIISGSFIEMQETVGQGLSNIELNIVFLLFV